MKTLLSILIISLMSTSCGFKSLYSLNEEILNYKINILVKTEPKEKYAGRDAQMLKSFLSERLHRSSSKPSKLKLIVLLQRSTQSLGLQKDLSTTKYSTRYSAEYIFYDRLGVLDKGTVRKSSSFDLGNNSYANLIAEETTNKNIIRSISKEIVRLSLSLNSNRKIYP